MSEPTCTRCEGSGRVANTDDGEPWSAWENLPPGRDMAVRLGLVKPIPCPACATGAARAEGPQETPRYSDGRLMPIAVGMPITDVHREIVRKYLGTGPGEVVTAEMVNRAITFDRQGAVPYDQIGAEQSEQDPPAERQQAGGTWRPVDGPVRLDWSEVTIRPDDDQPVDFPPASILDPTPGERLQATVDDVRARRTGGITIPVRVEPDEDSQRLLGTAVRRDALHAAALVYQGRAHDVGTETILLAADDFAAWLRDEPLPDPVRPRSDVVHPASTILGYTLAEYRDLDGEDVERMVGMLQDALDDPSSSDIDRAWFRTALAILRRQR